MLNNVKTATSELDEIFDFQERWHKYVGQDYWGDGFAVFDKDGKVEAYKVICFDGTSGRKLRRLKRKLLGYSKDQNGEVIGYILTKSRWYEDANKVIERNKSFG